MLRLRTLTLSLLLTIVVASVGSGLLLDKLYSELYSSEPDTKGLKQSQLDVIGAQLSATIRKLDDKEEFIQLWQAENSSLSLEIITRDDIRIPEELLQKLENTGHIILSSSANLSYYSFLKEDDSYLVIRSPLAGNNQPNWLPILFTFIFYALLMLIVFTWLFPLIRRLQTIQLSAKKLGEGDLSARITPSIISHIKDIELEFNRMAQRIEELVSDISLLSSAISHEMRAPLAKLQFGLDALREEDDEETRRIYQDRLDKVIADMTHLIDTLLKYARLDKNIAQLPKDEVDLLAMCAKLITSVTQGESAEGVSSFAKTGITINAKDPFYIVKGDVFYLNLLIENLLANAVKYGRDKIIVSLDQHENQIFLAVEDSGPGIAENFKKNIFKPFIRGEETKSESEAQRTSQKGYGLGMALVKRIADLHNVEIEITQSETLGGAKLILVFSQPKQ